MPIPYLEALRARGVPFNTVIGLLREHGLETAKGWDPLLDKFRKPGVSPEVTARRNDGVRAIYLDLVLYGDKAVAVFPVDAEVAPKLAGLLPTIVEPHAEYRKSYPLPLDDRRLNPLDLLPHAVAGDVVADDELLELCSKRYYTVRDEIDTADLGDGVRKAFDGYDSLIGVRRGVYQAHDFVAFSMARSSIEVRVDVRRGMTGKDVSEAIGHVRAYVNGALKRLTGIDFVLGSRKNFFPRIVELYNEDDGRVACLGHATGTSSIKDERMRRRRDDLREETFHKEGLRALGDTNPYKIIKTWEGEFAFARPGVTIPGHFSLAGDAAAVINYVIIDHCVCRNDFELVRSKLY